MIKPRRPSRGRFSLSNARYLRPRYRLRNGPARSIARRSRFDVAQRNREEEAASFSKIAFYPDAPPMELHKAPRDGQTESSTMMHARRRSVDLGKLTEDELVMVGGYPSSRVAHLHQERWRWLLSRDTLCGNPDGAACWCKLERVADEIHHHVHDLVPVAGDARKIGRKTTLEGELLLCDERLVELTHLVDDLSEREFALR